MKQVYAPANSAEAHMLAHLLEQAGIAAHIHGEGLQAAVGELPAGNLIQLLVADEDYDAARKLILDWERAYSAPSDAPAPRQKKPWPFGVAAAFLIIGLVLGWGAKVALENTTLTGASPRSTFDYNHDGIVDFTYYLTPDGSWAHRGEGDSNSDGAADYKVRYSRDGATTSVEADNDFDGVFETRQSFDGGTIIRSETITGSTDGETRVSHFRHGILASEQVFIGGTLRTELFYDSFRVRRALFDDNGDGQFDTSRDYDSLGRPGPAQPLSP